MEKKEYHWTRPYCTVSYYRPVGRAAILSAPWCDITVRSPSFTELGMYLPMPAGMFTDRHGQTYYRREYLEMKELHFSTEAQAKEAAEKWVRLQAKKFIPVD